MALRAAAGLSALRSQIVPRLLRTLHEVLLETARQTGDAELLRASLYISELVADERYQLYAYLDKERRARTLITLTLTPTLTLTLPLTLTQAPTRATATSVSLEPSTHSGRSNPYP